MSALRNAALQLASRGMAIFPLLPRDKIPATANGYLGATKDLDELKRYWDFNENYNIGIACGESGVFVVDVDGYEAETALKKLEEENGALPETVEAITGRNAGRHIYFRMPAGRDIRNSTSRLAPNIDVRGRGGYTCAPPSIHETGRRYTWSVDSGNVFADPPQWLVDRLVEPTAKQAKPAKMLATMIKDGIDEGARDVSLTSIVGHLLSRRVDPEITTEIAFALNEARLRPPLDQADVIRIVNSIAGRELRKRQSLEW